MCLAERHVWVAAGGRPAVPEALRPPGGGAEEKGLGLPVCWVRGEWGAGIRRTRSLRAGAVRCAVGPFTEIENRSRGGDQGNRAVQSFELLRLGYLRGLPGETSSRSLAVGIWLSEKGLGKVGGCVRCRAVEAMGWTEKALWRAVLFPGLEPEQRPRASTRIRCVLQPFFLEAMPVPVCYICHVGNQCCFNGGCGPSPLSLPRDSLRVGGFQVQGEEKVD